MSLNSENTPYILNRGSVGTFPQIDHMKLDDTQTQKKFY
jgi:hypothetical protein